MAALLVERVEVDEQEYAGGHEDGEEDEGRAHFEEGVFGLRCFKFHVEAGDIGNVADKGHRKCVPRLIARLTVDRADCGEVVTQR